LSYSPFIRNHGDLSRVTQAGVVVGQPVEHGVERADEEVVPQLHDGQPHQVPQEEPRQQAAAETRRWTSWKWKEERLKLHTEKGFKVENMDLCLLVIVFKEI